MATRFQIHWLNSPEFKDWILQVPNDVHQARCSKCHKNISLSNMGRRALTSHAKGAEHIRRCKDGAQSPSIAALFLDLKSKTSDTLSKTSKDVTPESSNINPECPKVPEASSSSELCSTSALPSNSAMKAFLVNDMVMKAEIKWCLQTVVCHKSMRSASADVSLFKFMFPDSQIAQKMQLQRSKIAYSILYGISPYFKDSLMSKLRALKCYTVGFDESLNKVSQRTQMDINVRFWDLDLSEVNTRYLTSVFLNRTTSDHLRAAFKDALLPSLDIKHIVQISMDGPNVNHKFFRDLKQEYSSEENPIMINIGTCGLHTMNCAFKSAIKGTDWPIIEFLRALYNLFKDVPARRGMYTEITGSTMFPKKFCSIRWLENSGVAQRALEMLPDIIKYVNSVKGDKSKRPSTASFKIIAANTADPLLSAKLAFFMSLSSEVEPFLKEYQTDVPLIPFLYTTITNIMKSVLSRFVKPNILKDTPITCIDVSDAKNLMNVAEIDLGYGTQRALKKKNLVNKIQDSSVLQFRRDCLTSLKILSSKLLEKSPIAFPIIKSITCFDPSIAASDNCRRKLIRNLLTTLDEHRQISSMQADQAEKQFHFICSQPAVQEELKAFSRHSQRIDNFWNGLFKKFPNSEDINSVMQMVMILFHGNSNVERGFSVNKECVVENMKEDTLVAQRIVHDAVMHHGKDINNLVISKSLVHSYKNARSRLTEETKKREREVLENKDRECKKKKLDLEKKELQAKISEIKENALKEVESLTEKINSLNEIQL